MAISYVQKQSTVELLQDEVKPQSSVVLFTTYNNKDSIDSSANFKLRRTARDKGVVVKVIKNTLISRVFELPEPLVGQTIVAFMEDKEKSDEIVVPKTIVDIIDEDFKDSLSIVGSFINGEFYDSAKTKSLAKVATKEESLSQIAGMLQTIISKIAVGVKEVPTSVARGVSEYSKTLS